MSFYRHNIVTCYIRLTRSIILFRSKHNTDYLHETTGNQNLLGLSHEVLRRRASNLIRELWYTFNTQLSSLGNELLSSDIDASRRVSDRLFSLRNRLNEMSMYLEIDIEGIGRVDALENQRITELDHASQVVQQRIQKIQNPSDCSKARVLLVSLNRPCAFGCNVHHLAYCLQLAYFTGRTLLFESTRTSYDSWWITNFLPITKTCNDFVIDSNPNAETLTASNAVTGPRVVLCPYIGALSGPLPWLPPAVPADISTNLSRLHGAPFVWFIGQLVSYLMRPAPAFEQLLNATLVSYGLSNSIHSPVVGLHIRRTDKINTEAAFHDVSEYVYHADRRFDIWDAQHHLMSRSQDWMADLRAKVLHLPPLERRVFVATDEPSVFRDMRKKFPTYIILGDPNRASSAGVHNRLSDDAITGIALDIMLLSKTDYLVCTFSSQVCRLAYELMQSRHADLGDASALVQSLDDSYYFGGQQSNPQEAIIPDPSSGLRRGDLVHVLGNHWNGEAKIKHTQNAIEALVPAFKLRPRILAVPVSENDV
ncbi:unnamed protein product [Dicrocoelium dendriticum]|nr:unnamed protein product [Dicrocoelium dendriticum]